MKLREKWGVSKKFAPWTGRQNFKGTGLTKTPRVLDLVDMVFIEAMKGNKKKQRTFEEAQEFLSDVFLDVSQGHSRKINQRASAARAKGITPTLTTSSEVYSFGLDRVITPLELMALHGHPENVNVSSMTPSQVKKLAGEGMAVYSVGSVIWALFLTRNSI